jgi:uncharacterized protein
LELVGRVARLRRYPVKSMMGEDLKEAHVSRNGIVGDRIHAFVQENAPNKNFPWLTARDLGEMLLYKPRLIEGMKVEVTTPDGKVLELSDEELEARIQEKSKRPLQLRFDEKGCMDAKPLSLIGTRTIASLESEASMKLSPERFRANVYVDWIGGEPFYEDSLVGKTVHLGTEVRIRVVKKDSRCVIPTLDPANARPSPEILEVIKKNHAGCAGVYAVVESEGKLSLSDPVSIA